MSSKPHKIMPAREFFSKFIPDWEQMSPFTRLDKCYESGMIDGWKFSDKALNSVQVADRNGKYNMVSVTVYNDTLNPELLKEFNRLNKELGFDLPQPTAIDYRSNWTAYLGKCYHQKAVRQFRIFLADTLPLQGKQVWTETLIQEMCHAKEFITWFDTQFCDHKEIGDNSTFFKYLLFQAIGGREKATRRIKKEEQLDKELEDLLS